MDDKTMVDRLIDGESLFVATDDGSQPIVNGWYSYIKTKGNGLFFHYRTEVRNGVVGPAGHCVFGLPSSERLPR